MRPLSETQAEFRAAIAGGPAAALLGQIRVPADGQERLEIYRRHYRESFRRHLRGRFPTVEWLLGTERLVELADTTLRMSPPRAPNLAAYGAELIDIAAAAGTDLPPYIADVARLDWRLGTLSVAISHEPLALAVLAMVAPEHLAGLRLTLQPGLSFLKATWPVDDLVHLRHADRQPEEFAFAAGWTLLQLRGARGSFSLQRLAAGDFTFRAALQSGETLAEAAANASRAEPSFDLSTALASLFAEGLVISHSGDRNHA